MTTPQGQAEFWNDRAGCAWVEAQELLDGLFHPLEESLRATVSTRPAARVLDVGCGTGGTTLAAARALGAEGSATGVDVSEPMIAAARERAERAGVPVRFLRADAQTHSFDPDSFDLLISRFGVMFFSDPVAAFANLRRAAAPDAELRLIVWREREQNPFMTTAERAAAPLLPDLPPHRPDAPGQFAFADPDRVRSILAAADWSGIELEPADFPCAMPESDLLPYLTRLGPVGRALQEADEQTRARVIETVRPAFDPFVDGDTVRFTAACWEIAARNAPPA